MPDKHIYEYAVIRLVPRVEREEFINIGVIVFCKRKGYLGMRYQLDEQRIALFSEDLDLQHLHSYLQTWELIAAGDPQGGDIAGREQAFRFRWLTAPRSTIIQSSRIHVGRCVEPEQVLENLFGKYVLPPIA
ncbi:MAG: DUF3037 domain-containing protein [Phaeodactylibacter sp.]|nr:DUF3037 domain-containing protein [Phaeodactylibacter sp.]